jgi:hypothetical protein
MVPLALVRELRAKLRDYPEWNFLYKDEESRDQQLARILNESLEDINLTQPMMSAQEWTFSQIPTLAVRLLLDLAAILALEEVSIWMVRNQFQYQAGNTSVKLYDQWQAYRTIASEMRPRVEGKITEYKVKLNIDQAYGMNLTELYDSRWIRDASAYITVSV